MLGVCSNWNLWIMGTDQDQDYLWPFGTAAYGLLHKLWKQGVQWRMACFSAEIHRGERYHCRSHLSVQSKITNLPEKWWHLQDQLSGLRVSILQRPNLINQLTAYFRGSWRYKLVALLLRSVQQLRYVNQPRGIVGRYCGRKLEDQELMGR